MDVPAGWQTDLAVRRLSGSVVSRRSAHVAVVTPGNPAFHWGNFLLVTDPSATDDADTWVREFRVWFPRAGHVAIGLPGQPDPAPWAAHDLGVESEAVLAADGPIQPRPLPDGYVVRRMAGPDDWAAFVAADLAEPRGPGGGSPSEFRSYAEALAAGRALMSQRGDAAFFGALGPDGALAARLGIVLCGSMLGARQVARYQHVGTAPAHRGRGLAGHLLGVACAWAAERGADRWEIHVDPGTPAHRLYSGLGFGEVGRTWQAYRGSRS